MKKRVWVGFGVGLVVCVALGGCERGVKRNEVGESVVKEAKTEGQVGEAAMVLDEALITRVEVLRDREFGRRPKLVAESVARLEAVVDVDERPEGVRLDREAVWTGLMRSGAVDELDFVGEFEGLARYDAGTGTVRYANGYEDREMLRLAVVLALVKGLNTEHFGGVAAAKSWDESLALEASVLGDAMFVAAQDVMESAGHTVETGEFARFPEVALRSETLRRVFDGSFATREGYALAAALYRVNGWSAVEMMKHAPPRSSGYVVRPDRWFSGEDLGTWSWPGELEAGWDEEIWRSNVQSGRVGPAQIAMWLGKYIDPVAARTVYGGWRSDEYRLHHGKRIASARRKGAIVFEWVSQWDTPHSAAQVADAFRLVLGQQQSKREDGAEHVVVQKGVNVAVIITDSESDGFRGELKRIDRAGVLSGAVVRYGEVQSPPFTFQPTRLEEFLVRAREARLADDVFEDPASGVRMDLTALKDGWKVQKTDEVSIRWFARLEEGDDGALMQFTTELRDVLGPAFGTDAYREKIEAAFGASLGTKVEAKLLDNVGKFEGGSVLEIRGKGSVAGKARALWVRQFQLGDVVCTLSLQDSPGKLDAQLGVMQAVFDGIVVEQVVEAVVESGNHPDDGSIRVEFED